MRPVKKNGGFILRYGTEKFKRDLTVYIFIISILQIFYIDFLNLTLKVFVIR